MSSVLRKLFYNHCWGIGWRFIEPEERLPIGDTIVKYQNIIPPYNCYYADPFCITTEEGKTYLFVEYMKRARGIGSIAVSELINGKFGSFKECIKEPFHMSYPNVFIYENEYYMIPETNAANQLILYKATSFPYNWEKDTILAENVKWVDSSFYIEDGMFYLFVYSIETKKSFYYQIDMKSKSLLPLDETKYCIVDERPAGNAFTVGKQTYRAVQDCKNTYGERVYIYMKDEDTDKLYCETKIGSVETKNIELTPKLSHITKTHTFNRTNNIEVVDYLYNRFYITKPLQKIISALKRG